MPTYDYECHGCGHRFEEFASMTAAKAVKKCPECGRRARRLIGTGAGILFKGSGFYETDYRSKEYKDKAKKDSGSDKGASSGAKKETSGDKAKSSSSNE